MNLLWSEMSNLNKAATYTSNSVSLDSKYDKGHFGAAGLKERLQIPYLMAPYMSTRWPCKVEEDLGGDLQCI
jgi:hypothetical protein